MTSHVFRALAVVFDLVVLVFSDLLLRRYTLSELTNYPLQIDLLVGLSFALTALFLWNTSRSRFRYVLVILRALVFALLTVTIPVLDLRFLPATLSFTVLLAFHTKLPLFLATEGFWAALVGTLYWLFPHANVERSLWGYDLPLYALCSAAIIVCAAGVRWVVSELGRTKQANRVLSEEVSRLSNANLGFQQYASALEGESTRSERLRLSREIHDSAGYALTTLKMLFEAAKGLLVKDPKRIDTLMDEGARISQEALHEIRYVLRQLRTKEEPLPKGLRLVVLLVRNFEKACGIEVHLETTNARNSYSDRVNSTMYRMVQEGMTNAFHHGRATEVSIVLAEVDHKLSIRIRDNGVGSVSVKKGIGLSGMEERVAEAGGWMQYKGQADGFEINALVPIEESP
ncbi:MAG: sensor histidine kinase [Spirochaetales bacterium]